MRHVSAVTQLSSGQNCVLFWPDDGYVTVETCCL